MTIDIPANGRSTLSLIDGSWPKACTRPSSRTMIAIVCSDSSPPVKAGSSTSSATASA